MPLLSETYVFYPQIQVHFTPFQVYFALFNLKTAFITFYL